ncbi:MAG: type II toxin-antitoxin system VapC family toxin [Thermodesulfobacteriota bacterium]
MRAYIDSDVLIWHLRGKKKAKDFIRALRGNKEFELWIGAMQRAEVVFFMRKDEEEKTLLFLSLFKTAPLDQVTIDRAGEMYREWNPSHGIDTNDAILAATAMETGGKIFCLNTRHYPMPDLLMERAW